MPLFKEYIYPEYELGVWKVEESYEDLLRFLPDNGQMYTEELESHTSQFRKTELLSIRVLLYRLLKKEKRILYAPNGKPYLSDRSANISISHTKKYVAVIISSELEVGIDIERYSERVNNVAHKFIRTDEDVYDNPGETTTKRLLMWSAKETMFKSLGATGVDFREHLKIDPFPMDQCYMNAYEYRTERKVCFHIPYIVHTDFVLTWAATCRCEI